MKKIIALFICAVVFVSCFCFPAAATSDGVVKADRVSAKPGEEISVPVSYVDNPGVYIIRVTVSYDVNAVEYLEIINSASNSFNYTVNPAEGSIVVLMDGRNMTNVTGDLELFVIKFEVKKDAPAGRALFPVYCEEGMATSLKKEGGTITPVALTPATSTGSVTVLCGEHTFDLEMSDGGVQCSKCGAVKNTKGDVSVDTNAGLPEIDVSASSSAASDNASDISAEQQSDGENKESGGLKFGHFIPIIAAVIVAVAVIVIFVVYKKKKNPHTSETENQE